MAKARKMYHGQKKLNVRTSHTYTNVVTGAELQITTEDARALYKLSSMEPSGDNKAEICITHDQLDKYEKMRGYLRKISKEILFVQGDTTDFNDLLSLTHVELVESHD